MAHRKDGARADPDRYLTTRSGIFYYKRRIPTEVQHLDKRGAHVRQSLNTTDLALARALRDTLEQADGELWSALLQDASAEAAESRYRAALKRAAAMGFSYRPAAEIATSEHLGNLLLRMDAISKSPNPAVVAPALLGAVGRPTVTVKGALKVYLDEVSPAEIAGKSEGQRTKWRNGKTASVDDFVSIVGDLPIDEISRDDARKFYGHFLALIAPADCAATRSASLGNRRIGDMRGLYRDYFAHLGEPDRRNPFDGLSFRDKARRARKRPSLPVKWIADHLLRPGALERLNDEARGILLVVADIGARPSEIANLTPAMIVLNHEIPHLRIEPRFDPEDPREIKTESSIRVVPLTGLALAVMRRHPKGFPRYKDKEARLSAALNKYLRENDLLPSRQHSVYSLRHSFEDRMKEGKVDAELRKILMGHALDRPEYGEGGSLALRREAMLRAALPFEPSIV